MRLVRAIAIYFQSVHTRRERKMYCAYSSYLITIRIQEMRTITSALVRRPKTPILFTLIAFTLIAAAGGALRAQTPATLTVDINRSKASVIPTLYGLMTEEINYSYDGGL